MRSNRQPPWDPALLGEDTRQLLSAIAIGRVWRDGEGAFAPYLLDGLTDVGMHLRWLRARGLVHLPLAGLPRLTIDGEQALTLYS
jgi:hypothetical protein